MTTIHLRGKTILRVLVLSSLSLPLCHPAKCQDYKPGDPIKFGGVHKPMNTASPGSTYTAAPAYSSPAAPSFPAPDTRSLIPVTSPTSYNPVSASPSGPVGGGGYSAPPATSFGALPPGELSPAPGTPTFGQSHPAPYDNSGSGQSFSQAQASGKSASKHQHTTKPPHQAKTAGSNQQAAPANGGDNMITGFWKAMAKPFTWAAGLFH